MRNYLKSSVETGLRPVSTFDRTYNIIQVLCELCAKSLRPLRLMDFILSFIFTKNKQMRIDILTVQPELLESPV